MYLRASKWVSVPVALLALSACQSPAAAQGTFSGRVAVEWLAGQNPERDMRLLEPFTFTDAKGKKWHVPAGTIVNGASIPQAFWSFAGSPYTGNYRRASVVHDYFCDTKTERWEDVHRMFYFAMVAGGVAELEAKVFYSFVYAGGPRWTAVVTKNLAGADETLLIPRTPNVSSQTQDQVAAWIRSVNPTLDSIEQRLDVDVVLR
jgi:hypothetical protein